jgi:hypothetical protein
MQTKLQNEPPVVFKKILLVLLQIRVVVNVDVNFVQLLSPIRVMQFCFVLFTVKCQVAELSMSTRLHLPQSLKSSTRLRNIYNS